MAERLLAPPWRRCSARFLPAACVPGRFVALNWARCCSMASRCSLVMPASSVLSRAFVLAKCLELFGGFQRGPAARCLCECRRYRPATRVCVGPARRIPRRNRGAGADRVFSQLEQVDRAANACRFRQSRPAGFLHRPARHLSVADVFVRTLRRELLFQIVLRHAGKDLVPIGGHRVVHDPRWLAGRKAPFLNSSNGSTGSSVAV